VAKLRITKCCCTPRLVDNFYIATCKFTLENANKWYEKIIQHPCKWVIEYIANCIGVVGLRPYKEDNKARFSIEIYDNGMYGYGIGTMLLKWFYTMPLKF